MGPQILAEFTQGHCILQAVLGDMTSERVDAIVNAANSRLAHGGGLAGAIVGETRSWLTHHPESSLTAVRFTAFDGPTAKLFAVAVRAQATFMPESSFSPGSQEEKDPK